MMAYKKLDENFAIEWVQKFNEINLRASTTKNEELGKLYSTVEYDLTISGVSGIEDRLQEGVPETIELLINANIRVWVLTGDKKETALNIGKTCRLIEEIGKNQIDLTSGSIKTSQAIEDYLDSLIFQFKLEDTIEVKNRELNNRYYLIVDGANLIRILRDQLLKKKFFIVGLICRSVICCRVSPKQKSEVVTLAKVLSNSICLSIGDGSNDVPMIMEANIGVGIIGKEGTQAVRSSDYSIGQFKFLQRLVFCHGRDGYKRVSIFICYYFYKNIILVFPDMALAFLNGFSGQVFYVNILTMMYNCFWTSWPCIFAFGFEKDFWKNYNINDKFNLLGEHAFAMLKMYKFGQTKSYFNYTQFWKWVLYSLIHSSICYVIVVYGLTEDATNGRPYNHTIVSTIVFSCVLKVVTYKLFLETQNWNFITIVFAVLSIACYYACLFIFSLESISFKFQFELAFIFQKLFKDSVFYFCLILVPLIAITPDICVRLIKEICYSNPAQSLMNQEIYQESNLIIRNHADLIKRISSIVDPRINEVKRNKTFAALKKKSSNNKETASNYLYSIDEDNESITTRGTSHTVVVNH